MKKKRILLMMAGMVAVVVTAGLVIKAHISEERTEKEKSSEKKEEYVTYEVDFEDGYIMRFEYIPGLMEFGTMEISGVVVDDFGEGTTMLSACHVPANRNMDSNLPRTAEEYLDSGIDAAFYDALPYKGGDATGNAPTGKIPAGKTPAGKEAEGKMPVKGSVHTQKPVGTARRATDQARDRPKDEENTRREKKSSNKKGIICGVISVPAYNLSMRVCISIGLKSGLLTRRRMKSSLSMLSCRQ